MSNNNEEVEKVAVKVQMLSGSKTHAAAAPLIWGKTQRGEPCVSEKQSR